MPVVLLRHIVAGVFCFRLLYLYCMPPTVLDVCQVKYKKTFSGGKKSANVLWFVKKCLPLHPLSGNNP
jgi:hypothetical protein